MPSILPKGKQQYFDNAGNPLVGGKLYTYLAGTNTPKPTFADADGLIQNQNPVVLDNRGEARIYWSGAYKVVLKDSNDNTIWTVDNVVEVGLGTRTSTTGSSVTPAGTTDQRDDPPLPGYFRYNTDLACFEGRYGDSWISFVKSVNGDPVPDGGDIEVQETLVSGTNIKTIGGVSLLGSGDVGVSPQTAYHLYLHSTCGGF